MQRAEQARSHHQIQGVLTSSKEGTVMYTPYLALLTFRVPSSEATESDIAPIPQRAWISHLLLLPDKP